MQKSFKYILLSCSLASVFSFNSVAATLNIVASKDATIYSRTVNSANGAGEFLFSGRVGPPDNSTLRRAFIAFDFVANPLPAGAVITNIILQLTVNRVPMNGGVNNVPFALHRVTKNWAEGPTNPGGNEGVGAAAANGDVTWTNAVLPGTLWNTVGGDFNAVASATTLLDLNTGLRTWSSAAMINDVKLWVTNAATNFGWILIANETMDKTARRFDSRTSGAGVPTLIIGYTNGGGGGMTNNPTPSNVVTLTSVTFDKLVPKDTKKLSFKIIKGFNAKGKLFTADRSPATNAFTGDIYAFFRSGTGTNAIQTPAVKLTQKPRLPKGQVKKGLLAQFKTDKVSGRVAATGASPVDKDQPVQVVFFASNSTGVLYKTNSLTAKNIK